MIINMNGAKAPETPSSVLQEKTVTPETLPTVIGPDEGYDGLTQVTVNPDAQLKAENIRSGKTIFGVDGVFEGTVTQGTLLKNIMNDDTPYSVTEDDLAGVTKIPYAFFQSHKNLISVDIPESVTIIYSYAFQNSSIQHIKIPASVVTWGGDMCYNCDSLTDVVFSEGITAISPYRGFSYCDKLKTVVIPSTVTSFGTNLFMGSAITSLIMKPTTPPTMPDSDSLPSTPSLVITVPKGCLEAYQTASVWSQFASKMVEATE